MAKNKETLDPAVHSHTTGNSQFKGYIFPFKTQSVKSIVYFKNLKCLKSRINCTSYYELSCSSVLQCTQSQGIGVKFRPKILTWWNLRQKDWINGSTLTRSADLPIASAQLGQMSKTRQKLRSKKFLKLTGHSYACNNLTNFEYEANAMTGHRVNLLKLAWKNSWNQVILFLSGFGPFGPTVRRRLTIIDREKLTVTITTLPTLQMFAGIYRDFAGKSKCRDFKFTGIACIPAISVIFEVNQKKCGLFIYTLY